MRLITLFAATAFLAGCMLAPDPAGTDRIAPGYASGGGEWSSGGGITAVARVFEREGRTIVCGAWMMDQQSALSVNYNEDVMAVASVFAGGARVSGNLSFMRRLEWRDNLTGAQANCVVSSVPWQQGMAETPVLLRFPRISFGDRAGSIGGRFGLFSGDTVTFREGPRPNPVKETPG